MKRRDLSAALLLATGVGLAEKARAAACPSMPAAGTPPGDVRRYGADPCGTADSTAAFNAALAANREIYVPKGTYKIRKISLNSAGSIIRGESRYESKLIPSDSLCPGEPLIHFAAADTGTCYGNLIENLHFELSRSGTHIACVGVDLKSINNTVIQSCRFKGLSKIGALATGVVFNSTSRGGSYSNAVTDCDFQDLLKGVCFKDGANNNYIFGGEFTTCVTGVDAAPAGGVDTPKIFGPRFEQCQVGLLEGAQQGMYFGLRFEENGEADVKFLSGSDQAHFFGGFTSTTTTPFTGLDNAHGLVCLAPDLFRNTMAGSAVIGMAASETDPFPVPGDSVSAYLRGGRVALDNSQWLVARTANKTEILYLIMGNASGVVEVGASGRVDVGNTSAPDRTRIFKPCFQTSESATSGTIVNKFPVYAANGALLGYVPIYDV